MDQQKNNVPLSNDEVQNQLSEAIEKISEKLEHKSDKEVLMLIQAYLSYAKTYSRSNNKTPSLRSKGLEEALLISSRITNDSDNFLQDLRIDLKSIARSFLY